jgi:sugar lactone lactonase YvrE
MDEKLELNQKATSACGVCSQTYTDPVVLSCLHSFCQKCFTEAKDEDKDGFIDEDKDESIDESADDGKSKCPTCHESVSLTNIKLQDLPRDLKLANRVKVHLAVIRNKLNGQDKMCCSRCEDNAIVFCCDCCYFLCNFCQTDHIRVKKTASHVLTDIAFASSQVPNEVAMYCSQHSKEELKQFCLTCQVPVCCECITADHEDHDCDALAAISMKELEKSLTKCDEMMQSVNGVLTKGAKMLDKIYEKEEEVKKKINNTFTYLQSALNMRCQVLLQKADKIANNKKISVSNQMESFEKLLNELSYASEVSRAVVESSDSREMMRVKESIKDHITHCSDVIEDWGTDIKENEKMFAFVDVSAINRDIRALGGVSTVDASSCIIDTGLAIPLATVDVERKFTISTVNGASVIDIPISGSLVNTDSYNRKVEKLTINKATIVNPKATASFIPQRAGEFEVSLTVEDKHIKGSPCQLLVRESNKHVNVEPAENLRYNLDSQAYGVAVSDNGDVFASSPNGCYIQVFNNDGSHKYKIDSFATNRGIKKFACPQSLIIVGEVLYVIDNTFSTVYMFSTITGHYLKQFNDVKANRYEGITYDGSGRILVADSGNQRVIVFTLEGEFLKEIDCNGETPNAIAVDNDGLINITSGNRSNCSSSPSLIKLENLNVYVSNSHLRGIAIDGEGCRYITCSTQICVLNSSGSYFKAISTQMQTYNRRSNRNLYNITLDHKSGSIYVAENTYILKLK